MRIVCTAPGVLRDDTQPGNLPITEGIQLLTTLAHGERTFVTYFDWGWDETTARDWLRREQLWGAYCNLKIIDRDPELDTLYLLGGMRRDASPPDLVLTAQVPLGKSLIALGYNALLFCHPVYLRAEWHPHTPNGRKAWDDVVEEIESQRVAKAGDRRLTM